MKKIATLAMALIAFSAIAQHGQGGDPSQCPFHEGPKTASKGNQVNDWWPTDWTLVF